MFDFCYLYSGVACPPGGTPYQWPTSREMLGIAGAFPASVWMHHGLYVDGSQYPPYIVPPHARPALRYAIAGAKATEIGLSQNPHLEGASDVSRDR